MARKLRDALPGGEHAAARRRVGVHAADALPRAWPPLHRDAFVIDEAIDTTVDLAAHRGDSALDDLDLDDTAAA